MILNDWGLEEARQVSFDEATCDLRLLESPRTSYGKGKRAIFLTAFSIAVMEHALDIKSPHLRSYAARWLWCLALFVNGCYC